VNELSVVIVSFNSRADLERSLPSVVGAGREVVVVDNASADGSAELVRERFPGVRVVELPENVGYGAACNEGLRATGRRFVLVLNPDAWPIGDALQRLLACASENATFGALAPQLHDLGGTPQPTSMGFPTRWWTGRPAITSVRPSLSRHLPRPGRGRRFLVGAALLLRREAFEQVGGFDRSFFMFSEEVDLCWRLQEAGWRVGVCPGARFVHVGGASTRREWPRMYREQLRGHLRFLAKHHGLETAERARRYLVWTLRARALTSRGETRRVYHDGASWLRARPTALLLDDPDPMSTGRTAAPADPPSGSGR
jgi:GT2 family glycosyltransferase